MMDDNYANLKADIAVLQTQVSIMCQNMKDSAVQREKIIIKLEALERSANIEIGARALKATLWTAIAGGAGVGISEIVRWMQGGGPN